MKNKLLSTYNRYDPWTNEIYYYMHWIPEEKKEMNDKKSEDFSVGIDLVKTQM